MLQISGTLYRKIGRARIYTGLLPISLISIHAPTRGAATISGYSKPVLQFQSTLPRGERQQIRTIFNYIFNIILANLSIFLKLNFIHDVFQYQSTVFILFYKCESPCILVCASHSHKQVIESMFHPLLFPAQRQCSLFLPYTDFQDSKI